jgi:hypothetical protein
MPHISPRDYFESHYSADFALFGGDSMCGASMSESLLPARISRFVGIAEFVVCQFELNLLHQAIYTHFAPAHSAWRAFSAPFANTQLCFHGHGMGSHLPHAILRFAQEPWIRAECVPVILTWDMLADYSRFFLHDYVERFIITGGGGTLSHESFLEALSRDHDCMACLKTAAGWETRHVRDFLCYETAA